MGAIYSADKARMRHYHHAGPTGAPIAGTLDVPTTGRRFSVKMLSAVDADGQFCFMRHQRHVTADLFLDFLERLLHQHDRPVFLVVDGHSTHKTRVVRKSTEAQAGPVRLVFLPPYSPHLNPDEQVWGKYPVGP